jgi:hypothetical protein
LLKKTDFFDWKTTSSLKKADVVRKYRLSSRKDYNFYNNLVGYVTKMADLIAKLPDREPFKKEITEQLVKKLFDYGLVSNKDGLEVAKKLTVSAFL